jgi:hypothetical protein
VQKTLRGATSELNIKAGLLVLMATMGEKVHMTTDAFRKLINEKSSHEFQAELGQQVKYHSDTMALFKQVVKQGNGRCAATVAFQQPFPFLQRVGGLLT